MKHSKSAQNLIEDASTSEELTLEGAATELMRFALVKCVESPHKVGIHEIGQVLDGAARILGARETSSQEENFWETINSWGEG